MDKINKNQIGISIPQDLTGTEIKKDTSLPVPAKNLTAQVKKYKVARNTPMLAQKATNEQKKDKSGRPESTLSKKSGQGIVKQGAGKTAGKLYVIEGARKDLRSIGKNYQQLKNAIEQMAAGAAMKGSDASGENELSAEEVAGLAEATIAVSKIYVKFQLAGAKMPVRLCVDVAKKYSEIRRMKAELQLKNIMTSAPPPVKKNTAPKVKAAKVTQSIITVPLSEYEKACFNKYMANKAPYRKEDLNVIELPNAVPLNNPQVVPVIGTVTESTLPAPEKNEIAYRKPYNVTRSVPAVKKTNIKTTGKAQNKPGKVPGKKQDKTTASAIKTANKVTGVQIAGVLRTVNGIRKDVGKLYLLEGAKKDIGSVKKDYRKLKDAMALLAAKSDTEENKDGIGLSTNEVLGYAEATAAVTKIYLKVYMAQAKAPVRLTKDTIKIIKVIRKSKAESVSLAITKKLNSAPKIKSAERPQSAINTPVSAINTEKMAKMLPDNVIDSIDGLTVIELPPDIPLMLETSSDALPVLDTVTDNVLSGSAEHMPLPMGTEMFGDTVTDVMPSGIESSMYTSPGVENSITTIDSTGTKVTIDVLPPDYKFDVSALEEKYGIHGSARNVEGVRAINSEVHGVKPGKGTEAKTVDHTPKKITEPGKAERIQEAEKKYGVKSKNNKDNLDKSKKEKKGNKKGHKDSIAKREFKKYIVEQLLLNGGNEDCSSGIEVLVNGIAKGKAIEIAQSIFSAFGRLAKKGLKKLLWWILTTIFTIIQSVLQSIFSVIMALVTMIGGAVILLVGVVSAGVLIFAGLFASLVNSGEFAVTKIDSHVSAIMKESENYDEVNFYPDDEDEYSNYDDMLLVYLSKVADLGDDTNLEGEAPFMWIDKRAEKNAIAEAVESMFYYETSVRKETRTVEISVPCTPALTPEPSSETQYTVITQTVTVEIKVMDIYIKSADEYMETVSKRSILENYEMLKDVFKELGYKALGGTTVCDVYGIEYDSSK